MALGETIFNKTIKEDKRLDGTGGKWTELGLIEEYRRKGEKYKEEKIVHRIYIQVTRYVSYLVIEVRS